MKNYLPTTTLIRNKLNSKKYDPAFFEGKGLKVKIVDENLFSVRKNGFINNDITKLFEIGAIYRGGNLVCYKGQEIDEYFLHEARKLDWFIWNEKTVFSSVEEGKRVYMYWDPKYNDWSFADNKEPQVDVYKKILHSQVNNIYELESQFTYVFKIQGNARSVKSPVILDTIIDNKKGYEVMWDRIDKYGMRLKVDTAKFYKFEGFKYLEDDDFPLYATDKSKNKIYIKAKR